MNSGPQEQGKERQRRKQRREQLKACLARAGLGSGPRLVKGSTASIDYLERVIYTLSEMGLVFTRFGQYLATRYDQIPAADCLLLRKTGMGLRPTLDLASVLQAAFAAEPWSVLTQLQEIPAAYGRPMRRYQTILADGLVVNLSLQDPDFFAAWPVDSLLLDVLSPTLRQLWPYFRFEEICQDFTRDMHLDTDAEAGRKWLVQNEQHKQSNHMVIPAYDKGHSNAEALVTTHPPVTSLRALLDGERAGKPVNQAALPREICLAWLQQALVGDWFPTGPDPQNLAVLGDGRVLFRGGVTATLSKPLQARMVGYLMSVAAGNPDDAIAYIKTVLIPDENSNEQVLQHRFRQIVPFRDGNWGRTGMADSLAEHLFVQWRVIGECGYAMQPAFRHFCRGLAGVAYLSMKLAPESDVLRKALYEFRMKSGLEEMRQGLGLENIGHQAETFFAALTQLPQRLEKLQERAAQAPATPQKTVEPQGITVLSLILVLLSLALFSQHFSNAWAEPLSAVLFLFFGGLLLRLLMRS